jgi:LCP family protein required for cell wall assembly
MGEREKGVADSVRAEPGMKVRAQRAVGNSRPADYRDSIAVPYATTGNGVVRRADPPRRKPRKRILFPLAVLIGLAVGVGVAWFSTPTGRAGWKVMHQLVTPKKELTEVFHTTQTHVLLLGLDHVPGRKGEAPDHRSDSIIVAGTDFNTHQIRLVSIPRDSWVPHYLNGEMIDAHQKLGHTYAEGGVQCTKETVEQLLGVPIDHYVTINFDGFQKVIDAIGGIDINVDEKMDYDDNWGHLHIHLQPGLQHMDGETAMGYARFRHDLTGDIGRMSRQQIVLKTMLEKMRDPSNLPRLPQLFQIFQQNVDTDLSMDQLLALAQNMDKYSGDGMQTMTVENYGPYDGAAYPWGRHSFEGNSMAQYLTPQGIEAARMFLTDLNPPPPPEPALDEQDKGWSDDSRSDTSSD